MGKQRGQMRQRTYRTAQDRKQVEQGQESREVTAGKGWGMALRRPHPQALCGSQTLTYHARPLTIFARCAARSACSVRLVHASSPPAMPSDDGAPS